MQCIKRFRSRPLAFSIGMVFVPKISGAILPNAQMLIFTMSYSWLWHWQHWLPIRRAQAVIKIIIVIVNFTIFYLKIWRFVYMECGAQVISLELPGSKIQSRCLSLHTFTLIFFFFFDCTRTINSASRTQSKSKSFVFLFSVACASKMPKSQPKSQKVASNKRCINQ